MKPEQIHFNEFLETLEYLCVRGGEEFKVSKKAYLSYLSTTKQADNITACLKIYVI